MASKSLNVSSLLSPLPEGVKTERVSDGAFDCVLFTASQALLARGESGEFKLKGMSRYLALLRKWVWSYPVHGTKLSSLVCDSSEKLDKAQRSEGIQLLLWERKDGLSCLLLPLVGNELRAALESSGEALQLKWNWEPGEGKAPSTAPLMAVAVGRNPVELVRRTLSLLAKRLKTFRLRGEKRTPAFIDYLGWCTWDAFYRDVDERKVLAGLASFAKGGVRPGFMILDDGWQDVDKEETLLSFGSNSVKFPHGLQGLAEKVKAQYGLKFFGVWHAFEGYWKGVNPSGPLGGSYPLLKNFLIVPPPEGQTESKSVEHNLVEPEAAARFYNDYHSELRKAGVDLVKIDNQSGLDVFVKGKRNQTSSMRLYQEALQGSTQNYFLGNCISCMSNGSDVLFHMNSSNLIRSSNDYFPKRSLDVQGFHIVNNAMNALWFSNVAIADWDMFQSHGPCAEFHAAARALSGGPVYVCDEPGKQDFSILRKLCLPDSRVLRFDEAALPLPECVYVDPQKTPLALKLVNRRASIAALGLFNCHSEGKTLKTSFKPCDIDFLSGDDFAVYFHKTGEYRFAKFNTSCKAVLGQNDWEVVTIAPLEKGIAPLGLADKYAGAAALRSWRWIKKDVFACELVAGGRVLFLSKRKPSAVTCKGKKVSFRYEKGGLLSVTSPETEACEICVLF